MGLVGRAVSLLLLSVSLVAIAVSGPHHAAAECTCGRLPLGDPLRLAGEHDPRWDHAFVGTVVRAEGPVRAGVEGIEGYEPGRWIPYIFDVEIPVTGEFPDRAIVLQRQRPAPGTVGSDCSVGFADGARYLVEARVTPEETYLTSACTFTSRYGAERNVAAAAPMPAEESNPTGVLVALGFVLLAGGVVAAVSMRGGSDAKA